MTSQAMTAFDKALRADPEMTRGLLASVEGKHGAESAGAFAAYARAQGFDVTTGDAEALRQKVESQEGALSDDQLEDVAGGSLLALGAAAAFKFGTAAVLGAGGAIGAIFGNK